MRVPRNFLTAALAGATVLAANLLLTEAAFAGNAIEKCTKWRATGKGPAPYYTPNSVKAKCDKKDVELWLPGVMGVSNGQLVWAKDGHFDRSSKGCVVQSTYAGPGGMSGGVSFGCSVKNGKGWKWSSLSLSQLSYANGKLFVQAQFINAVGAHGF